MHAAAVAKKRKCKNCNMHRILFSHDEDEGERPEQATAPKSVPSRQNTGNESVVLGGMRACSHSSTVTASSVDSVASAIRSPPSLMSLPSDFECDSGGSGVNSRSNSVSCGVVATELDRRARTSTGNRHPFEEDDREATELLSFDDLSSAEMEDALNELLPEYEEDEDAYLQFVSFEGIEEWYEKAHRLAELIECSCAEDPGPKFVDSLPEFTEDIHMRDDSDNFRLVLGIMADRICDEADDKKKLINKRNPAGFAIPFLDQVGPLTRDCAENLSSISFPLQNLGILRSITQLFSVRNPPRGDHDEAAVLREARERMRKTKGHVLALLLGEAVSRGGVVWAEGARAARIIEDVIDVLQMMFKYFFALISAGDIEGLTLAHKRAREEILPMLETTLEEDTWRPIGDAPSCSGRTEKQTLSLENNLDKEA